MSLKSRRQSVLNLVPKITILGTKAGHPHLFNCYSDTSRHSYLLSVTPFKPQECDCGFKVHCLDKTERMSECDGNCRVVCKHSLAAIVKRLQWQGKKISLCESFRDAKRLLNLFVKKVGKLVKIEGMGKSSWGVVYNA